MNIRADQIERIKELGYTEAEARFIYIVAIHSGYFTLRQFLLHTLHFRLHFLGLFEKFSESGHIILHEHRRDARATIF